MVSRIGRSGLWVTTPRELRQLRPGICDQGWSSATSLMVKSNSLRATKSTAGASIMLRSGCTATLAPIRPALICGLAAFKASMVATSDLKDGTEVWATTRSKPLAMAVTSLSFCPCGGASTSLDFSTRAAGWASQVGYQKERISRLAW